MSGANVGDWVGPLSSGLEWLFGGDYPVAPLQVRHIVMRAVLVYLAGIAIVRIGKSRLIGRISALDVLIGFVLGSLMGRGITGSASLSGTGASCATIVAMHWLLTLMACRWHWFGDLVKGRSHLIVQDGQPLPGALRRHHLSPHDLEEEFRLRGVADIRQVREAFKERNGEVSVLTYRVPPQILEIAVAEGVQTVRIKLE
jgi:uncharacterized membrane protein YcaP (DUF421 family)